MPAATLAAGRLFVPEERDDGGDRDDETPQNRQDDDSQYTPTCAGLTKWG